jgi:hypothetical protein
MDLNEAGLAHYAGLANLPSPRAQGEVLMTWRAVTLQLSFVLRRGHCATQALK